MPRPRPSMSAQGPSDISSSSGASFHTNHETRRSMHPGMQARASETEDSDIPSYWRSGLSAILDSARHDEESESSRRPSSRHPVARTSDGGDSDSGYSSKVGRSNPSQAGISDYSLDPRDSTSNGGSSPSDNGYVPRSRSPRRYLNSNTHPRYTEDEYFEPRRGGYVTTAESDGSGPRRGPEVDSRDRYTSSSLSDSYSEGPRTLRSYGGSGMSSRYNEDEGPFTPRGYSGRSMSNRHDDDEEEEIFTPRG